MKLIDLRSDTVTKPSPEMRQAMYDAEVGDDVFEDDPTVQKLEEKVAALFGREASLFVPSGTMGNQVALRTWARPGDELLLEEGAHIFNYEVGGAAALTGLVLHPLPGRNGVLSAEQIEAALRPENIHHPRTRLVSLENTHNRAGGTIYPLTEIQKIRELAQTHGLKMHLDGARIWNAAVAVGVPLSLYGSLFDSVMTCLSKGLGAPIGSVVIGDRDYIAEARRQRKMLGGGMRQVGILAAAGIYAIDNNFPRLAQDHEHAKFFARALAEIPGLKVDLATVETNIVVIDISPSGLAVSEAVLKLKAEGVLVVPFGAQRIRAVAHLDATREDFETALSVFRRLFAVRAVPVVRPLLAQEPLTNGLQAVSGEPEPVAVEIKYRLPIDLARLRQAFTDGTQETNYFLSLRTAEIKMISYLSREEERDKILATRNEYLLIAKKNPKDGYRDMEDFIAGLTGEALKERLRSAIQGKGAFRRFKDVLMGYPEERRQWFRFSEERDFVRLRRWLGQEGIAVAEEQVAAQ